MHQLEDLVRQDIEEAENPVTACEVAPLSVELPRLNPELIQGVWESSGPIVFMILLCRFFMILTRFVQACQQDS